MYRIRGNKWNKRICKWFASLLTVILLVNQIGFSVLAEEPTQEVCCCNILCSEDSVNEACPVCVEDYGKCEGVEDVTDTDTDEETENPDANEDVNTDTDTNTVPDTDTDTDILPDTDMDEETEDFDAGEGESTEADANTALDMDADVEVNTLLQNDEAVNVNGENAVNQASVGDTFSDNGFIYTIISEDENNRQVEVSGHIDGASVSGALLIPPTASNGTNEYTVVRIGKRAFYEYNNLTSIIIPNGATSIEEYAFFHCSSLESITISDSVTYIGPATFSGCSSLKSVTIPSNVTIIGSGAFQNCSSLESITLPDGITHIQGFTFSLCSNLKSITLPDSITNIGMSAFEYCSSLESITIPNNVTWIGSSAFVACNSLKSITIPDNVTQIVLYTFRYCENLNSFSIALTENITGTPTVHQDSNCFEGCPADRFLSFLTKDGTELSDTTTPTLAEAVKVYDEADGITDDQWYGWKLSKVPDVTGHSVTININKDGSAWSDCAKAFALSSDNGATFITDLTNVSNGTYTIYDITGATDSTGYINTGVTVGVNDNNAQAEINYYSVTFYNGNDIFSGQIVPNNTKVSAPLPPPTKEGHTFYRWATSGDGSTEFNFDNPITSKTDIYASWTKNEEKLFTIRASADTGGSVSPSGEVKVKSGANQQFIITPEDGYQIASILVDGSEVLNITQTNDYLRAGITDAESNAKYYVFENVTTDHTLEAYFKAAPTGDDGTGSSGGNDTGDKGTGGSGGVVTDGGVGDSGDAGGAGGSGASDTNDNSSDNSSGNIAENNVSDSTNDIVPTTNSDTDVITVADTITNGGTAPASRDKEPKTGDTSYMEIYATIAMIAGLSYLLLYFADGKNGMSEEEKKEIVGALVKWAKNGNRIRKYAALAMIFLILVYYHSIGKRTSTDWKEVYER